MQAAGIRGEHLHLRMSAEAQPLRHWALLSAATRSPLTLRAASTVGSILLLLVSDQVECYGLSDV